MKKVWVLLCLSILTTIFFQSFFSNNVKAGQAGVGVGNIPPKYNMITLTSFDNTFRVKLTIFDHNSWEDIQTVSVILEDNGGEKAKFIFKQYETNTSSDKINEFSEISIENNLLITKKCSYDYSEGSNLEKCNLNLLFVFKNTGFTRLNIIAVDTAGGIATIQLDYTSEDLIRSENIIIIPGIGKSAVIEIPPYFLDLIALIAATFGTWYVVKKTDVIERMRAIYEET
jgi:hypothetical protein